MNAMPPTSLGSQRHPLRDLSTLRAALVVRLQDLTIALLGNPSARGARQWRWGTRGSLSVEMAGRKAGTWFDHEVGSGGGPLELIGRQIGGDWRAAADWARQWLGESVLNATPRIPRAPMPANDGADVQSVRSRQLAAERARRDWASAQPAPASHPYLLCKQVQPHGLRQDRLGRLVVPLVDVHGAIHTLETIDASGSKRFLADGAKVGHFAVISGSLASTKIILIAEGWATAATVFEATGIQTVAAMDAGNLCPVATSLRRHYPDVELIIIADNDDREGRADNPGVAAATAAASLVRARIAIPPVPGDMNDIAIALGVEKVRSIVLAARPPTVAQPTYPRAILSPGEARAIVDARLRDFVGDVEGYWTQRDAGDADDG